MFRTYLAREIEQWQKGGLLQPGQGDILLADHDRRHTGFSLSGVLAVLAAVLFGGAVVAFVAANWEAIDRLVRVALIVSCVFGGLSVAAIGRRRRWPWITEAALVFVLLSYGAAIALIGQMYHLSGDEVGFMLLWSIGALVVAVTYSSRLAAISAALLSLGLLAAMNSVFDFDLRNTQGAQGFVTVFLVTAATGFAAWRANSTIAGRLAAVLLILWVLWIATDALDFELGHALTTLGLLVFLTGSVLPMVFNTLFAKHGIMSSYGALMLLTGLGIMQFDYDFQNLWKEVAMASLILCVSVVVLIVAGAHNRFVRRLAYFAFAAETLYVISETMGTLLGSASFLFLGGIVLAIIALAVMQIEKLFKRASATS